MTTACRGMFSKLRCFVFISYSSVTLPCRNDSIATHANTGNRPALCLLPVSMSFLFSVKYLQTGSMLQRPSATPPTDPPNSVPVYTFLYLLPPLLPNGNSVITVAYSSGAKSTMGPIQGLSRTKLTLGACLW